MSYALQTIEDLDTTQYQASVERLQWQRSQVERLKRESDDKELAVSRLKLQVAELSDVCQDQKRALSRLNEARQQALGLQDRVRQLELQCLRQESDLLESRRKEKELRSTRSELDAQMASQRSLYQEKVSQLQEANADLTSKWEKSVKEGMAQSLRASDLENSVRDLSEKCKTSQQLQSDYSSKWMDEKTQCQQLRDTVMRLRLDLQSTQESLQSAESENQQLKQSVRALEREQSQCLSSLSQSSSESAQWRQKCEECSVRLRESEWKLEKVTSELSSSQKDWSQNLDQQERLFTKRFQSLTEENLKLKQENSILREKVPQMQKENSFKQQEIEHLQSTANSCSGELQTIMSKYLDLENENRELKSELCHYSTTKDALEETLQLEKEKHERLAKTRIELLDRFVDGESRLQRTLETSSPTRPALSAHGHGHGHASSASALGHAPLPPSSHEFMFSQLH